MLPKVILQTVNDYVKTPPDSVMLDFEAGSKA